MFLRIEGDQLINLTLISRVEFIHRRKTVTLWNAGVVEVESEIAYAYFMDPANADFLFVKTAQPAEAALPAEVVA